MTTPAGDPFRLYLPNIQTGAFTSAPPVAQDIPFGPGCGFPVQYTKTLHEDVATVGPMAWVDWGYDQLGSPADTPATPYLPMVYGPFNDDWRTQEGVLSAMSEHRDRLWLGMNEPHLGSQANMTPSQAVDQMAILETTGARVTNPSVMLKPGYEFGLAWLAEYLRIGGSIPTVWNIHIYGVQSADDFFALWDVWAAWRDAHDGEGVPTIISEFNASPGSAEDQLEVLDAAIQLMDEHLQDGGGLTAALWFASRYRDEEDMAWLLAPDGTLTDVGQQFARTAQLVRAATGGYD